MEDKNPEEAKSTIGRKKAIWGVILLTLFLLVVALSQKSFRDGLCMETAGKVCFYGSIPFKLIPPR